MGRFDDYNPKSGWSRFTARLLSWPKGYDHPVGFKTRILDQKLRTFGCKRVAGVLPPQHFTLWRDMFWPMLRIDVDPNLQKCSVGYTEP